MSQENRTKYDSWSSFYDRYPNPTVAIDDQSFPDCWQSLCATSVLELGCGTGRHTIRLAQQGNSVTGIDQSPGMLAVAKQKCLGLPVNLIEADLTALGALNLPTLFGAVVCSLVMEHIADPAPVFAALRQKVRADAKFYLSEIHPWRTNQGIFAHFKDEDGKEVALDSTAHAEGYLEIAAAANGWVIEEQSDVVGDAALAARNPKWARYLGQPMLRQWRWRAV